jgi:hypothetical protein
MKSTGKQGMALSKWDERSWEKNCNSYNTVIRLEFMDKSTRQKSTVSRTAQSGYPALETFSGVVYSSLSGPDFQPS